MIINLERKFIFIHVPKTGGRSIQIQLHDLDNSSVEQISQYPELTPLCCRDRNDSVLWRVSEAGHWRIRDLYKLFSKAWVDTFKVFAFVRNPWDQVISSYFYDLRSKFLLPPETPFETWLADRLTFWSEKPLELLLYGQHTYIINAQGQIPPEIYLFRFERLQEDFRRMCEMIGLGSMPLIVHDNQAVGRKPYQAYYTPGARDLVGELFARDVELFGYEYNA